MQRLCGIERTVCQMVPDSLVDEQFLCVRPDGHYALLTDGEIPYARATKSDLRPEQRLVKASLLRRKAKCRNALDSNSVALVVGIVVTE
jgi:hypothetical protein